MHELIDQDPRLAARPGDGHKGTFGRVVVVGGSAAGTARMIGAPALAATGAVRAGCGLVRAVCPGDVLDSVLTLCPFATGVSLPTLGDEGGGGIDAAPAAAVFDDATRGADAIVVGPGFGSSDGAGSIVLRAVVQEDAPCVLDADGLNLLCAHAAFWEDLRADLVLTPHPGEARRLMAALSIGGDPAGDEGERIGCCVAIARRLGCVVVLKGAGTVVSDGLRAWVCRAGHPCLGTGGTGDVLAGVIGGLVAQTRAARGSGLFDAARAGVLAHARAGEAWARAANATGGMTPNDLAGLIPSEVERLRSD